METKISRAIIARFASPIFFATDSTLDGYEQPKIGCYYRPRKTTSPFLARETPDELLSQALRNPKKEEALTQIIEQYNTFSVFRFKLREEHFTNLEQAIYDLKATAAQVRNIARIIFEPFNENIFNFTRKKLLENLNSIDILQFDDLLELSQVLTLRPDWAVGLSHPSDFYYSLWLLRLEEICFAGYIKDVETTTPEQFLNCRERMEIDMVEEAMRQALIFFHGRDPIPEEPIYVSPL